MYAMKGKIGNPNDSDCMLPISNNPQQCTGDQRNSSDQQVPYLELDGEILERIVEGCEDQECSNKNLSDPGCNNKGEESEGMQFTWLRKTEETNGPQLYEKGNGGEKFTWVNPVASSTMIEAYPDSSSHDSACSCPSVYTWTIHENDEDFILEDSYMKYIDLCMYENEALGSVPKVFQRTSTRVDLSFVKVQEVPSNSSCEKEAKEKKYTGKKPMGFLKTILRIKKSKDADNAVLNSKNIWKKIKRCNDKKQSDVKTLAVV